MSEEIVKRLKTIEKLLYLIVEEQEKENRVIENIIGMLIIEKKWIKKFKGYDFNEKNQRIDQINIIIEKLKAEEKK